MKRWIASGLAVLYLQTGGGAAEPVGHEAYIWQRAWGEPVRAAISQAAPALDGLVALGAEVAWDGNRPRVVRVPVDWAALRATGKPFGVALRVGAYRGPFDDDSPAAVLLTHLAAALVREADQPHELQVDFDCATAGLDGYRQWVQAIKRRIAPVPLTITVLPTWLDSPAFARLAAATDGYVLQVHSLERPSSPDRPLVLCDPQAARRAVARASLLGVPFRVALPTYGYLVAFDNQGRFIGLSAEGPAKAWPAAAQVRTVRADAPAMAVLVKDWTVARPTNLEGFIWYRLPTAEDALNWRWRTLAAVIAGRVPRAEVQVRLRHTSPVLVEVEVVNDGEADGCLPPGVRLAWQDADLVAADAVGGYERVSADPQRLVLRARPSVDVLAAGDQRVIGWLRLTVPKEVEVHVSPCP